LVDSKVEGVGEAAGNEIQVGAAIDEDSGGMGAKKGRE
jgi:hypothetical protein